MSALAIVAMLVKLAPLVQGAWENKEEIVGVVQDVVGLATKFNDGTANEEDFLATDAKLDAALLKFNSLRRPA